MRRPRNGGPSSRGARRGARYLNAGVAGLTALLMPSCSSTLGGFDNTQLVATEARIQTELAADNLAVAENLIAVYERRVPGPEAQALLGRITWRTGDLLEAEAMFRRGSVDGYADGRLGVARAAASRGRWEEARALAEQAEADPAVATRARRFLAAVDLATGNAERAVESLYGAAAAEPDRARADRDRAQAAALLALGGAAAEPVAGRLIEEIPLFEQEGELLVPVHINGVAARLRLALDATRTSITPELAVATGVAEVSVGGVIASAALEAPVTLRLSEGVTERRVVRIAREIGSAEGTLGFDVLVGLRWMLELDRGVITVALASAPVRGTVFDLPSLRDTHWARVRVLRDGLSVQLMLMPRLAGHVVSAAIDVDGGTVIDVRRVPALPEESASDSDGLAALAPAETHEVELRFGGWQAPYSVGVADLYPRASDGCVAPQMVLGGDVLRPWRLRWSPESRQLALTPVLPETGV